MRIIPASFSIEGYIDGIGICKAIEKAGRTCYKSEGKVTGDSYIKFIKKIIKSGHHSVLEHEKITVRVICDRGISHELVRHRLSSYSQESSRYCSYNKNKFGNEIAVIEPCFWPEKNIEGTVDWYKYQIWLKSMKEAELYYMNLIELGAKAQEARDVLPNSLKTEIVISANLRQWRTFFFLRVSEAAHPQMREITIPMLEKFKELIPIIFDDILVSEKARSFCYDN